MNDTVRITPYRLTYEIEGEKYLSYFELFSFFPAFFSNSTTNNHNEKHILSQDFPYAKNRSSFH